MVKEKSKKVETVEEVKETVAPASEVETVIHKEDVFPEVSATGKFQAVEVSGGEYVVYNPSAQRVTGRVTKTQATDIVRSSNQAAHIK
jgi:hypothetical protein